MIDHVLFALILISATLLCSLVAGFLLAFAIVAMPGMKSLNDREFIRAFQVIDGVIQNRQPIFMVVWIGSVVALLTSAVLGIGQLDGYGRMLIVCAALVYMLGVQLPTFTINVPLNNKLQTLEVDAMNEPVLFMARTPRVPTRGLETGAAWSRDVGCLKRRAQHVGVARWHASVPSPGSRLSVDS